MAKNLGRIAIYLMPTPAGQAVKDALDNSFADAQSNARRWLALGLFAERAGFRLDENAVSQSQALSAELQPVPAERQVIGVAGAVAQAGVPATKPVQVSQPGALSEDLRANLRKL